MYDERCATLADALRSHAASCQTSSAVRGVAAAVRARPASEGAAWVLATLLDGLGTCEDVDLLATLAEPVADVAQARGCAELGAWLGRAASTPLAPPLLTGAALAAQDPAAVAEPLAALRGVAERAIREGQPLATRACGLAGLRLHGAKLPLSPEILLCMVDLALQQALAEGAARGQAALTTRAVMTSAAAAFQAHPALADDALARVTRAAEAGLDAALRQPAGAGPAPWDALFMTCVLLLSAVADAGAAVTLGSRQRRAARTLAALADLQFCVMDLSQYPVLVRGALSTLGQPDGGASAAELFASRALAGPALERLEVWGAPAPLVARWTFALTLLPSVLSGGASEGEAASSQSEPAALAAAPGVLACLQLSPLASRAAAAVPPLLATLALEHLEPWAHALFRALAGCWERAGVRDSLPSPDDKRSFMEVRRERIFIL